MVVERKPCVVLPIYLPTYHSWCSKGNKDSNESGRGHKLPTANPVELSYSNSDMTVKLRRNAEHTVQYEILNRLSVCPSVCSHF